MNLLATTDELLTRYPHSPAGFAAVRTRLLLSVGPLVYLATFAASASLPIRLPEFG